MGWRFTDLNIRARGGKTLADRYPLSEGPDCFEPAFVPSRKLSETRPTVGQFLSSLEFDEDIIIVDSENRLFTGDGKKPDCSVSELPAEVYDTIKDYRIESISICGDGDQVSYFIATEKRK